jgi:2',3'-cyclic-nucleotide 2'-phosphodiesterase (5'-nucleotidase family)
MRTNCGRIAVLLAMLSLALAPTAWGEVIGKTTQPLDGKQARVAESTLADLVADAMRVSLKVDVALVQADRIRLALIPAGDLTRETLVGALLFPDEQVVAVEVTGRVIVEALERSLSYLPRPSMSFLQVSGLTVSYRSAGPALRRIAEVKLGNAPLSLDKTYRVAMPLSLTKGSMGYYRVFGDLKVKENGLPMGDALVRYVQANPNVSLTPGQRLRDLSPPPPGSEKQ